MPSAICHPPTCSSHPPRPSRLSIAITQMDIFQAAVDIVCRRYNITITQITSHCRQIRHCWPRWVLIHLLDNYTQLSTETLARLLDRTKRGIQEARKSLDDEYSTNPARAAELHDLEDQFAACVASIFRL